jgi:CPA2 family monovalent cation:H+ antiporter-2
MPHDVSLIATLAAGFGLALILGVAASALRLPPLVGYLLAGVLIGPATPGFVADMGLAAQLSEIGVMLLMFGVGLHFSLDDLMAVRRIAVPGALVQIGVATALGAGAAQLWGWDLPAALVFGLSLSVASTVVLLRALEARGQLQSMNGQIAVGWLIVEDLVMVLALVLLPAVAGFMAAGPQGDVGTLWAALGWTLLKVAAFIVLMLVVGRWAFPKALWAITRTGSRELFTLGVIAAAVGVAFGAAKLFDVSFALGAFFAGMMMRESEFSHRAADESLPLRDAFAVLFFVAVGMLFEPAVVWEQPIKLLLVVAIILVGKTVAAVLLVLLMRYPLGTALTVGVSLAQIGEFSFILAGLGVALNLLPKEGQSLILAGALVSIAANAALFRAIEPLQAWLRRRSPWVRKMESRDDPLAQLPYSTDPRLLTGHVVVVGHGRVGSHIVVALRQQGRAVVVLDHNRERVEALRVQGVAAVHGDAREPEALVQAHVARAAQLVLALPNAQDAQRIVELSRQLNAELGVVIRARSGDEADLLRASGLGAVFSPEDEVAQAMVRSLSGKA